MVVAESMAMGCPVLATNLGNHGDIVRQSRGGILFEPDSEESFADAVKQMISENERLSENAGSYYESVLNRKSNYKALEEIYRAVAAGT